METPCAFSKSTERISTAPSPLVVVGGSGKNVGKTTLVCGILLAFPQIAWTAVKVTSHEHGAGSSIWEETTPGRGSDTARYLAAGAHRAFLVTARDEELGQRVRPLLEACSQSAEPAGLIFESNRMVDLVSPDLCLAVEGANGTFKTSFQPVMHQRNATVRLGALDEILEGEKPVFSLAALDRISPGMLEWLRARLHRR